MAKNTNTTTETTALTNIESRLLAAADKQFTFSKRIKLKPGQDVRGIFLGAGPRVWVDDPADPTKENEIQLWNIQVASTLIAQVPSTAQLDKLAYYPCNEVICLQLLQEQGTSKSGRRFSDHLISEPESAWLAVPHTEIPKKAPKRDKAA